MFDAVSESFWENLQRYNLLMALSDLQPVQPIQPKIDTNWIWLAGKLQIAPKIWIFFDLPGFSH